MYKKSNKKKMKYCLNTKNTEMKTKHRDPYKLDCFDKNEKNFWLFFEAEFKS